MGNGSTGFTSYGNRGAYALTASFQGSAQPAPVSAFTASQPGETNPAPLTFKAGAPIMFDGRPSSAASGLVRYDWNFGDLPLIAAATGVMAQKIYLAPGTFTVSLQVTGANGMVAVSRRQVIITPNRRSTVATPFGQARPQQ